MRPNLRARCEINVWRVLSANSPTEPPHRAPSARRGPRGARRNALVTAHASAPGGAPFAATRAHGDFATRISVRRVGLTECIADRQAALGHRFAGVRRPTKVAVLGVQEGVD